MPLEKYQSCPEVTSRISRLGRWVRNNPGKTLSAIGTSATVGVVEEGWLHRLYDVALHVRDRRFTGSVLYWFGKEFSLHKIVEILGQKVVIPIGTMGEKIVPSPVDPMIRLSEVVDPIDVGIYDALMGTPANIYLIGLAVATGICGIGYGIYRFGRRISSKMK